MPIKLIQRFRGLAVLEAIDEPSVKGRQIGRVKESRLWISAQDEVCGDERDQDGPLVLKIPQCAIVESPAQVG